MRFFVFMATIFICLNFCFAAETKKVNEVLKSNIREDICSELIYERDFESYGFDEGNCLDGDFSVRSKTFAKYKEKTFVTMMLVLVDVKNVTCEIETRKLFPASVVTPRGNIVEQDEGWDVKVSSCVETIDYTVMNAGINDRNVRTLSEEEFKSLPLQVRDSINSVDLSDELGNGYYEYQSTSYFRVIDEDTREIAGYIELSLLTCTEWPDEGVLQYVVRYNSKGERLSKIGDYN